MAHVVDRLLAQLPGLQGAAAPAPPAFRSSAGEIRIVSGGPRIEPPTLIGLWGRVALGLALGIMMTGWPYFRECGFPLYGYLCAVAAVVVAGGWIALTAWELRNGVAHILALLCCSGAYSLPVMCCFRGPATLQPRPPGSAV